MKPHNHVASLKQISDPLNLSFYIARNLIQKSRKTFASKIVQIAVVGVALGFAVIIIAMATVNGFQKEISFKVAGFSGEIEVRKTGSAGNYDYPFFYYPDSLISQIKQIKGVDYVNVAANKPAIVKSNDELIGVIYKGISDDYNASFFEDYLIGGRLPNGQGEFMISAFMSKKLGLNIGDKGRVYFIKDPVRAIAPVLTGIYETGLEEYDKMFALGGILDVQRVFADRLNMISHIEVGLKPQTDPDLTASLIYELLNYDLSVHTAQEIHPQIFQWLAYLDINKYIILALMAFVCSISLITALLILVIERTNMIGILKTMGANNGLIKKIFLYHVGYITLVGLAIGNFIGIGLCYFQLKTGFFTLQQDTYFLSKVPVDIDPLMILAVNVGCFLLCFIALLIPVQMVTGVSPAKSVRFD